MSAGPDGVYMNRKYQEDSDEDEIKFLPEFERYDEVNDDITQFSGTRN